MTMQLITWSLIALWVALAMATVLRWRQQRRIGMQLRWPPSTSQRQMEKWGRRFLERMGWQVSTMASQATITFMHCTRSGDELFVVFLRDSAFFARLMSIISKFGINVTKRAVIVLYDQPLETVVLRAFEQQTAVAHFTGLSTFKDSESARLPSILAIKEVERRVRSIQTS